MPGKKIFHEVRRPSVSFTVGSKIYSGHLAGYWDDGLEIRVGERIRLTPGMEVAHICLGENGNSTRVGGLKVMQVRSNGDSTVIELSGCRSKNRDALRGGANWPFDMEALEPSREADPGRIPRFSKKEHYSEHAIRARLEWARAVSGARLENIARSFMEPESLAGNIENYIGAVQVPVGLAGPLLVDGTYTQGFVTLPIATTEGALVSSISRGAKACSLAGGIHVHVLRQCMVRSPVFFCESLEGAVNLERWVLDHFAQIKEKAESVSSVARLDRIRPLVFGNALHLCFYFSTGDASGQNMTSACTWVACQWIEEQIKEEPFIDFLWYNIEANMSGDKKVNFQNFVEGRGVGVTATCFVPGSILRRILRVKPEQFVRIWSEAEMAASQIGMVGSNINFANVIAGIFTATGQDIACVHESSCGVFKAVQKDDGLLFTAYLPSLVIGTVGGGTSLPVQKECLELMGCYGQGKLFRLAEIIAAACLALDISTGAAIVSNDFVSAHERLGRNRPTRAISRSEIDNSFFTRLIGEGRGRVVKSQMLPRASCSGIISSITRESNSAHGLYRYRLTLDSSKGTRQLDTFLKLKASGRQLDEIGLKVARLTGEDRLPGLYESQSHVFCLDDSHLREIRVYRHADSRLLEYAPRIYGTMVEPEREIYAILMEDLTDCRLFDSIGRINRWPSSDIETVLRDMAALHAVYFERGDGLERMGVQRLDRDFVSASLELLKELTRFNSVRYPELVTPALKGIYHDFLNNLDDHLERMLSFPCTLTHNDFNPRNLCLRRRKSHPVTVLYDWELAFFQNPQHDLIEFLVFVLGPDFSREEYIHYADLYLEHLRQKTGREISRKDFLEVLDLNGLFLGAVRMNLYLLGHNILRLDFLERVYTNLATFIMKGMN